MYYDSHFLATTMNSTSFFTLAFLPFYTDPLITLKKLPILLCCTAQKFYPLCSNYAQYLFLNSHALVALLWVNSRYLKLRLQILALLKRKDQPILTGQSALCFLYYS